MLDNFLFPVRVILFMSYKDEEIMKPLKDCILYSKHLDYLHTILVKTKIRHMHNMKQNTFIL